MKDIHVTSEIVSFVPMDKHDHDAVRRAIKAGYPAVELVLPNLLEWLQDINWPVARTLAPFLASIGEPLIPHLRKIFATDDEIWKAWVLSSIVEDSPVLALEFREYLEGLVSESSENEDDEMLCEFANEILIKYGWTKNIDQAAS